MRKSDLKPRKQPLQQRSRATVDVILQAAARVLARHSLAGFNTNRVAEAAGVSVGSLYQYFPKKEALVAALIDRAQSALVQALEGVLQQVQNCSLEDALRAIARLAIEQQYASPVLAAALDHEEKRLPVQDRLRTAEGRTLALVQQLLQRHAAALAPDLPAQAARDCIVITKALVEADVSLERSAASAPPAQLEERVLRALLGYLTLPRSDGASGINSPELSKSPDSSALKPKSLKPKPLKPRQLPSHPSAAASRAPRGRSPTRPRRTGR